MTSASPRPPALGDLIDHYDLMAHCDECAHAAMLDLAALIARHGATVPAISLKPALRCLRCDHLGGSITVRPKPRGDAGGPLYRPDPLAKRTATAEIPST